MTVKMQVRYEVGHSYLEEWEKTDLFCPGCGSHNVWHEMGPGDYYAGEDLMCLACKASFNLYNWPHIQEDNWQDKQRFEVLISQDSTSP